VLVIQERDQISTCVCLPDDFHTPTANANQQGLVLGNFLDFPILYAVPPYVLNILAIPKKPLLHHYATALVV